MAMERLIDELKADGPSRPWEGTFQEYLGIVAQERRLARHAHARIDEMIAWHGGAAGSEGVPRYELFSGSIFGLDHALDRLVQYFRAASTSQEVRRRIVLLLGPPASGKSSIVTLLKQGLERFTRSEVGATYAIKGCPMQEDPLHLVPLDQRDRLAGEDGIEVEGDLCPRCRHSLEHDFEGDVTRVIVRRVDFSQAQGVGIGSFVATSPQQQDLSRLVGSVDPAYFSQDRLEGAGRAFRMDGELEAANRGIMEFIEVFKSDERFLAVMLGVTQEQVIKLGSFGSVHADMAVIAHSNEEEYSAFVANRHTEALLDRLIVVRVPYTLQVSQEERIYRKLLSTGRPGGIHLAPLSLPSAAVLAVLSRLESGRGALQRVSLLDKVRLYDGVVLPPHTEADVQRLRAEGSNEGMRGISPRYVINRLADAVARERECLRPLAALDSLAAGVEERAEAPRDEENKLPGLLGDALKKYKERALVEVRRAALPNFQQEATALFNDYAREARTYSDLPSGEGGEGVDERLLSSLEWAINIREADRPGFRRQVMANVRAIQGQGDSPGYDSVPVLRHAIEEVLLPDRAATREALGLGTKGDDGPLRRSQVEERLVQSFGYCSICARDLVEFAAALLQGKDPVGVRRGRLQFR